MGRITQKEWLKWQRQLEKYFHENPYPSDLTSEPCAFYDETFWELWNELNDHNRSILLALVKLQKLHGIALAFNCIDTAETLEKAKREVLLLRKAEIRRLLESMEVGRRFIQNEDDS